MEGSIISAQRSRRKRTSFLVQIRLILLACILIYKALLAKLKLVDYTMWFGQIMVGSHTHHKRTAPEFVYDDRTTSSKGFSFWSAPMKRTKRNNKPQSWFSLTEQYRLKNAPVWSAKSGIVCCSPSPIQTCGHKKICDCQKVRKLKFDFLWKNGWLFLFWTVEEWRQVSCELYSALHSVKWRIGTIDAIGIQRDGCVLLESDNQGLFCLTYWHGSFGFLVQDAVL